MGQGGPRGITITDLLTLPAFAGATLVAGRDGLGRVVTGANVMEVPDIEQFVRPGELLLTTAYPVRDRPDGLTGLLAAAAALGLAAVAVKPLRYVAEFTDEVIATADRLAIPLLRLPSGMSFNSAIAAVLSTVLAEYGPEPGPVEAMRQRLSEVVLSGGGFVEMARCLAGALSCEVLIIDERGRAVGQAGPADGRPEFREFEIKVAGQHRGLIKVGASDLSLGQQRLVNQACFAAGLHMAQLTASVELDRRLQAVVLEELVSSASHLATPVSEHAHALVGALAGPQCVLLATCDPMPAPDEVPGLARMGLPGARVWCRPAELVAIVGMAEPSAARLRAMTRSWWRVLGEGRSGAVRVAAGSVVAGAAELPASHAAALTALQIAERTGLDVVVHEDLLVDRLLMDAMPDTAEPLIDTTLGPLLRHDVEHGTELCETLWAYLGSGSGAAAARLLFIHYNTLKYRLAKIDELVGANFADPAVRLRFLMALAARRVRV